MTNTRCNRTRLLAVLAVAATVGCGDDLSLPGPSGSVTGEPDAMSAVSPVSQPGRIGRSVADDPSVLVVDQEGNPVGGAEVTWDVTAGGGTLSSESATTGEDGRASVSWTLGVAVGVQKVVAQVDGVHGSPVTFTATVLF